MADGEPQTVRPGVDAEIARAREQEHSRGSQNKTAAAQALNKQRAVEFAARHGLLVAFFLWLLFVQVLGIYLFTSGFLLTRLVLDHKSECGKPPVSLDATRKWTPSHAEGCWHPKTFERAVVILVDALRYDFTVPHSDASPEPEHHHWHNALTVLHETAVQQPNNAILRPFIADPPTTTLQRLKGLTTGTLPTFIDAGSNFAGTAIDEDNLIAQLLNASKTVVHLGDDTWHSLFPGYFNEEFTKPFDSFNVWDLHTVDNGVNEHLFPLLQGPNKGKWDVLIGHYLGVDHAGHRYGPDHPAMNAKLQQMDDVLRRTMAAIDDDTLLVVLGDHGMDSKGDHGGESDDEVEAALWMYSKRPVFGHGPQSSVEPPRTSKEQRIPQIDLVPTLSLLLGLPIPFNNLGAPIEEAFVGPQGSDWENVARVNRLAAAQVYNYMAEYKQVRNLDANAFAAADSAWLRASEQWRELGSSKIQAGQWQAVGSDYKSYLHRTLKTCRDLWARFDLGSMLHGIEVMFGVLAVLVTYAAGIEGDPTDLTPLLFVRGVMGSVVGGSVGFALGYSIPIFPSVHTTIYCIAIGSLLGVASAFWSARFRLRYPVPRSAWAYVASFITVGFSVGFASNSYTIWEDQELLVSLITFGVLMLCASARQASFTDRALGCYHSLLFIILTRVASFSRLCREEQMPHCKSTYYASASSSTAAVWTLAIPFALAVFLPAIVKSYFDTTHSYQGMAVLWNGVAFRLGLFLVAAFWVLDAADDNDWVSTDKDTLKTAKMMLAQTAFGVAFVVGYALFGFSGPLLSMKTEPLPQTNGDAGPNGNVAQTSPNKAVAASDGTSQITILGYANAHGTRYFYLLTLWTLAVVAVEKPLGGGVTGLTLYQILALLEVLAAVPSLRATPLGPAALALLGSYHFFKTGHTAALSSIQWDAAFIPLRTVRYPWSPLLVALNAFGPQVLCAVAVPLTQLWKAGPRAHARGAAGGVARATAQHLLFYAAIGLATACWAGHLRRHLMLYRVFMPRFLMAQVVGVVVWLVATLVGIGGLRWSFASVGGVFGWL